MSTTMGKLYHYEGEGFCLQRPQDFRHFYPYSVFPITTKFKPTTNNNGDNK